jgi:hypothetical protein
MAITGYVTSGKCEYSTVLDVCKGMTNNSDSFAWYKCSEYFMINKYCEFYYLSCWGPLMVGTADGGTVVKVLCYKSEGRWFDSRWCHWNFSLT